jgi:hypothetical protein
MTRPAAAALDGMQKIRADGEAATKEGVRFEASRHDVEREVRSGSRATAAGRRMAQPVYPPAPEIPVRSCTYASCQSPTSRWVHAVYLARPSDSQSERPSYRNSRRRASGCRGSPQKIRQNMEPPAGLRERVGSRASANTGCPPATAPRRESDRYVGARAAYIEARSAGASCAHHHSLSMRLIGASAAGIGRPPPG